jgi:hypothetical protein
MTKLKLKALLLTILVISTIAGFSFLFWNYQNETLYVLISFIMLMFIRHTYVVIKHLISE